MKKSTGDKKETVVIFFKTNVENTLEEGSFRENSRRREELNAIGRKVERELRLETDPLNGS
jgi:hypothetical protein